MHIEIQGERRPAELERLLRKHHFLLEYPQSPFVAVPRFLPQIWILGPMSTSAPLPGSLGAIFRDPVFETVTKSTFGGASNSFRNASTSTSSTFSGVAYQQLTQTPRCRRYPNF